VLIKIWQKYLISMRNQSLNIYNFLELQTAKSLRKTLFKTIFMKLALELTIIFMQTLLNLSRKEQALLNLELLVEMDYLGQTKIQVLSTILNQEQIRIQRLQPKIGKRTLALLVQPKRSLLQQITKIFQDLALIIVNHSFLKNIKQKELEDKK